MRRNTSQSFSSSKHGHSHYGTLSLPHDRFSNRTVSFDLFSRRHVFEKNTLAVVSLDTILQSCGNERVVASQKASFLGNSDHFVK
jgi:hypothetical protein